MTLEKLVQKAHDAEVLLYFIGLLSEEDKREAKKAKRAMEALAKASGGTAVFPENLEEVEKVAVDIANEIRNQYIITYCPPTRISTALSADQSDRERPNRPVVRTRSGYYATPDGIEPEHHSRRVIPALMCAFLWKATRGLPTDALAESVSALANRDVSGLHADRIGFAEFWRFVWQHRRDLMRFLRWAERMERCNRGITETAVLIRSSQVQMLDWLSDPQAWIALLTLTALEIVLGIDNIIFISILSGKLPKEQQARARVLGLAAALITRLLLLLSLAWIMRLTTPAVHAGHRRSRAAT